MFNTDVAAHDSTKIQKLMLISEKEFANLQFEFVL